MFEVADTQSFERKGVYLQKRRRKKKSQASDIFLVSM